MEITIDAMPNGTAVMRLHGRLDFVSATVVRQRLVGATAEGHRVLVVDLEDVPFLDSSGLGALIGGLKAARTAGGDLRLARVGEQPKVVLALTTLDRVFQNYATVEEALGATN